MNGAAANADKINHGITYWSKFGAVFLAGWFSSSATYGTLGLHQKEAALQHVQAVDLPQLKGALNCEAVRGDRASVVASTAIVANAVEGVRVPSPAEIPKDNCPHPIAAK